MMFCPKCGSILLPKKIEDKKSTKKKEKTVKGSKGKGSKKQTKNKKPSVEVKRVMACPRCSYVSEDEQGAVIRETLNENKVKMDVIDADVETLPITDAQCPKCGNDRAYFWTVQTRAGDEAETKFLKCVKCKNIWRDYD